MADDLIGKLVADKYLIEGLIREGSSGDLFSARHEVMDRPVTLRILPRALSVDARWSRSFLDEARVASSVTHSNVLAVNDFGTDARGVTYVAYEATDGQTLRSILGGEGLEEKRAVAIASQIAEAVAAAHSANVVHGHLEPDNVFISSDETGDVVKVFGFGSNPLTVENDDDPRYLAPEQCGSYPTADKRSDVYALGVMLFEMLSGVVPFSGSTPAEVYSRMNAEPPPPLSAFRRDLHAELEPLVLTAMAVNPERRYPSMRAFAEDLQMVLRTPTQAAAAAGQAPARSVWQTAFIALAGIIVLAAALIYATSSRSTDTTAQLETDPQSLPVQPIGPATGAQEESLAKLPEMTEAEIMAYSNSNTAAAPVDGTPGGDGYNPWANPGAPPVGAPPPQYVPPSGQTITVEPGASQFMPSDVVPAGCTMLPSGVILCPQPLGANSAPKTAPTPKSGAANANAASANTAPSATPKPLATPPPRSDPAANKPAASAKPTPKTTPKPGDKKPEE